jgi:hypothetical protein
MSSDDIRQELASVATALVEEADDMQRDVLQRRQRELRRTRDRRQPDEFRVASMRRELVGLKARLCQLERERPNIAAMNYGDEGGGGMAGLQQWLWNYDESTGLNTLKDRISAIEHRIANADGSA